MAWIPNLFFMCVYLTIFQARSNDMRRLYRSQLRATRSVLMATNAGSAAKSSGSIKHKSARNRNRNRKVHKNIERTIWGNNLWMLNRNNHDKGEYPARGSFICHWANEHGKVRLIFPLYKCQQNILPTKYFMAKYSTVTGQMNTEKWKTNNNWVHHSHYFDQQ